MALDRYAAIHANEPDGPEDDRPTAEQILHDQNLEITDWHGKIILITGGTAGLGAESARILHKTGAKIFITGRDLAKGKRVAAAIEAANPMNPPIETIYMDHSVLKSVKNAASEFLQKSGGKLNVLMANAGIVASSVPETSDGFEAVFGINYLASFLLVQHLTPALIASSSSAFNSRLVIVSGAGHRASDIDPEHYNGKGEAPDPSKAYARSKTALILMANEYERRYGACGVHALSLNPGVIMSTEIARDLPGTPESRHAMYYRMFPQLIKWEKSVCQGAATQVWAAIAKELEGKGGIYLDDVQMARETKMEFAADYCLPGYKSWIWNQQKGERLWADSLRMVGMPYDCAQDARLTSGEKIQGPMINEKVDRMSFYRETYIGC